jgi:predicted sugar kinase
LLPLGWLQTVWPEATLLFTGTVLGLVVAYCVRFGGVALQSVEAGYARIPASLDDSARLLGAGPQRLLARVHLPEQWRCVVFGMRSEAGLHGDAEKQAFASLPPVPREISAELSRIALMELWPAAAEGQFAEFSDALLRYGLLAGKPFEQASSCLPHASAMADLIETLQAWGVRGCAQSSWGPTVMACCESADAADLLVEQFATTELARQYDTLIARFDSQGAEVREIDATQALATGSP